MTFLQRGGFALGLIVGLLVGLALPKGGVYDRYGSWDRRII